MPDDRGDDERDHGFDTTRRARHRQNFDDASFLPRAEIEALIDRKFREWKDSIGRDREHEISTAKRDLRDELRQVTEGFLSEAEIDARSARRFRSVGLRVSDNPDKPGDDEQAAIEMFRWLKVQIEQEKKRGGWLGRTVVLVGAAVTVATGVVGLISLVLSHMSVGFK